MNIKTKSYMIMGFFSAYVTLSLLYYPKIVNMISTSGFFIGVLIYLLTNPAYLLLVFGITKYAKGSKLKALLASFLIIFSFDMIASPRILVEEIMVTGSSTITNMGAIAIKAMSQINIPLKLGYYMYYWLLPILFMMLALELLGVVDFIRKIRNGGV